MAPEQMRQKRVGRRADVWAVGGVALLMATGDPPWRCLGLSSPYALMMAVLESPTGPPLEGYDLAPGLRDLVQKAFTRDVDRRPTARALLRHPWLAGDGTAAVAPEPTALAASSSQQTLEDLRARISREQRAAA